MGDDPELTVLDAGMVELSKYGTVDFGTTDYGTPVEIEFTIVNDGLRPQSIKLSTPVQVNLGDGEIFLFPLIFRADFIKENACW